MGKSKAMEYILTGAMFDAQEAEKCGLVSRVVEPNKVIEEALKVAGKIASFSQPIVNMAKECVNYSFNSTLRDGI